MSLKQTLAFISGGLSTVVADLFGPAISHPAPSRPSSANLNCSITDLKRGGEKETLEKGHPVFVRPPPHTSNPLPSFLMAEFSALYVSRYFVKRLCDVATYCKAT